MDKPLSYWLYMAESEGLLDTHESKMQNLLRDIKRKSLAGIYKFTITEDYLAEFDLKFEDLTARDYRRMEEVARTVRIK